MTTPSGKRHYCTSGSGYPHTSGDGAPKRKKCAYCGGTLATMTGVYGVFVWRGDGRYRIADAVATFARETRADAYTARDERYVVRWIVD